MIDRLSGRQSDDIDGLLAQVDLATSNIRAQRAHRQVVEFGRSAANPDYAAGAWLRVVLAWFAFFITFISRGIVAR